MLAKQINLYKNANRLPTRLFSTTDPKRPVTQVPYTPTYDLEFNSSGLLKLY